MPTKDFWSDDNMLTDLLLDTNLSISDISKRMGITQTEVRKRQKELGLGWLSNRSRKMSRGQYSLTQEIKKLIPNTEILNEYHIGEQLMLDIYCPAYRLAVEYHGRQHFEYISRFHATIEDFEHAVERDERKIELCKEQGITLVIFRYCDKLTEDVVYSRLLEAIQSDKLTVKQKKAKPVRPAYYEEVKRLRNERAKQWRRMIKDQKKKERMNKRYHESPGVDEE